MEDDIQNDLPTLVVVVALVVLYCNVNVQGFSWGCTVLQCICTGL